MMKPFKEMTKEELVKALSDSVVTVGQWMDAVQRVRELHYSFDYPTTTVIGSGFLIIPNLCHHCGNSYPCPTIKALDGETE